MFAALTIGAYLLTRWADSALKKKLLPEVCHHDRTQTSYTLGTTRCLYCGDEVK